MQCYNHFKAMSCFVFLFLFVHFFGFSIFSPILFEKFSKKLVQWKTITVVFKARNQLKFNHSQIIMCTMRVGEKQRARRENFIISGWQSKTSERDQFEMILHKFPAYSTLMCIEWIAHRIYFYSFFQQNLSIKYSNECWNLPSISAQRCNCVEHFSIKFSHKYFSFRKCSQFFLFYFFFFSFFHFDSILSSCGYILNYNLLLR